MVVTKPVVSFHHMIGGGGKATLTNTFLIIGLRVSDVLKLKLSQQMRKLSLCHTELWKKKKKKKKKKKLKEIHEKRGRILLWFSFKIY